MIYFEADDGRICLVFDYLGRALVAALPEPYRSQEANAVPGWLQVFLNGGIAD